MSCNQIKHILDFITTDCACLRHMLVKILVQDNRLVTHTLLHNMGKSESESFLYCKEIETQVDELLYVLRSTIHYWNIVDKWMRKNIQPHYKMRDWDKVFANSQSSFTINVVTHHK